MEMYRFAWIAAITLGMSVTGFRILPQYPESGRGADVASPRRSLHPGWIVLRNIVRHRRLTLQQGATVRFPD
jgi:hypothetical protein